MHPRSVCPYSYPWKWYLLNIATAFKRFSYTYRLSYKRFMCVIHTSYYLQNIRIIGAKLERAPTIDETTANTLLLWFFIDDHTMNLFVTLPIYFRSRSVLQIVKWVVAFKTKYFIFGWAIWNAKSEWVFMVTSQHELT